MKRISSILATFLVTASIAFIGPAAPAHADPCFFSAGEFSNWYNGTRWSTSLSDVEDGYAACTGAWANVNWPYWNGRVTQERVWPRADGGYTRMIFAHYDVSPTWRAHDQAWTYGPDPATSMRRECEWGRPPGNYCTPEG